MLSGVRPDTSCYADQDNVIFRCYIYECPGKREQCWTRRKSIRGLGTNPVFWTHFCLGLFRGLVQARARYLG